MTGPVCFALAGDFHRNSRARRQVLALSDAGLNVVVLHLPGTEPDDRVLPPSFGDIEFATIPINFGRSGPLRFLKLHHKLSAFLERFRFSAVHASDLFVLPALAGYAGQHDVPLFFDSRELYTHVVGTVRKPWSRAVWHLVQKRYLPRVTTTFTVSDAIADFLQERYDIPRPIVIPNVPLSSAHSSGPDVRTHLGLAPDDFLAIQLGAIRARRGCELAVEIVSRVQGLHVAFVGDGPFRSALARLAATNGVTGRIHFVDAVPPEDVTTFARTADVGLVLIPDLCLSYRFALPNKLFECISAGVPVVVSDLPEMKRVVMDHGVGLCVEPSDVGAAAAALAGLASDRNKLAGLRRNCIKATATLNWETYRPLFVNAFLEYVRT